MSGRRFFFPAERSSSNSGLRQRSWAECYAVPRVDSPWSTSESSGSRTNSPDQSHTAHPDPRRSSSSSSSSSPRAPPSHITIDGSSSTSVQSFPAHSPDRGRSRPSPAASDHRRVSILPQTNSWTRASSTTPSRPQPHQPNEQRHGYSPVFSENRSWTGPRAARRRFLTQICFRRRVHHGRQLMGHLPVAIPSDRWYTGVGSRVCAQCRFQRTHNRTHNRTSWMCLECRVPLCLLTWRNCFSQWHSDE